MYLNFREKEKRSSSQSRSREKNRILLDPDLRLMRRVRTEGSIQSRKQTNASNGPLDSTHGSWIRGEGNSFDLEFRRTSSKKASRTLMKAPIYREKISEGMETRQSSPGVVARLMGLDPVPPLPKHSKERRKTSSVGFPDKYEVLEMPKGQKQKHSKIDLKNNEIDQAVMKQKLIDDELQFWNEDDDALEDLDSYKDQFLNFSHKPNSLFEKRLQDLKCDSPSPRANITILKPSKVTKVNSHFAKECRSSLLNKSPEYAQIVVLKPSLEKALDMGTTVPLAISPLSYLYEPRQKKQISMSKRSEVYAEVRERNKLSECRELAREVVKRLSGGSSSRMVMASKKYGYINDEGSHGMSVNLKPALSQWTSDHLNDCGDILSSSSYYSRESSVSREARKCLSERWKMTRRLQEVRQADRGFNTLKEILVCDKEITGTSQNASKNVPNRKVDKDELLARGDFPLSINSKDSWKDGWSRPLLRSNFLPSSSLVCENHYSQRNKSNCTSSSVRSLKNRYNVDNFFTGIEEGELSEREIHVNPEDLHYKNVKHFDEEAIVSDRSRRSVTGKRHEGGNLPPQRKDGNYSPINDAQQVQHSINPSVLAYGGEISCTELEDVERQESSIDHPVIPSHCDIAESISPVSSKKYDQVSPVSVLDPPPSEEEKPSSECFEKISADLMELKMQLKVLKSESADTSIEDLELHISHDEDIGEESHILESFRNDEDRDFSYLLDVVIKSRAPRTEVDKLYNAGFSQEYPVANEVFEKLEKKYNVLVSWPKPERKLFFDLINSILASITMRSTNSQSMNSKKRTAIWACEDLVEDVWQTVCKQRAEMGGKVEDKLLLAPRWLDLGDDVKMLGSEVEKFIIEDLIEELFAQMICE